MRSRAFTITLLMVGCAAVLPVTSHADGLRCGSKLITAGDTRASVRAKCGPPVDIVHKTIFRHPSIFLAGRAYAGELTVLDAEDWTYNFGPHKFMRRVRFVDGVVEDIDTLDYGYHE